MSLRPTKRVLVLGAFTVAAVLGVIVTQGQTQAQEGGESTLVVGTYEPQQVAQQAGLQQKMQQEMQGLRQRLQKAQQDGNQQEMQKIQGEAQQIQQRIVSEFETNVSDSMPTVAESAGVDIIAVQVDYTAPGIETKDVTKDVIAEMGGGEQAPDVVLPQGQ